MIVNNKNIIIQISNFVFLNSNCFLIKIDRIQFNKTINNINSAIEKFAVPNVIGSLGIKGMENVVINNPSFNLL